MQILHVNMEVVKAQGMVTAVLVIRGLQGTIVKEVKKFKYIQNTDCNWYAF